MLQKTQSRSSGTCTASERGPSQAMETLRPHPAPSGTVGWGAKEGLVFRGAWTQQGEQGGTVHSHSSLMAPGEVGDI